MSQTDFISFLKNVGIREETAEKLWEGNIKSPQELASFKSEKLSGIVDDSVLINTIHPVLQQYAFPITMATDPYKKAIALLKKHCGEPEPMEEDDPMINGNSLRSDASPFTSSTENGNDVRPSAQPFFSSNQITNTTNPVSQNQSKPRNASDVKTISISGGNFVQSSFFSEKPIVINNTNTTVQALSYVDTTEAKLKRRSEKVDPSWIKLEDCTFSTANLQITNAPDYWPTTNDTHVNKVDQRESDQRNDDAYPVTQWNSNRALVINITKFNKAAERQGADVDTKQLKETLEQLGFQVTLCLNKTKSEIEQSLREFRSVARNKNTSISLVFIGSHGDRKDNQDCFIGSDNHPMTAAQVIDGFTGENCPWLVGKPKLFFFQFCRQDNQKKKQQIPANSRRTVQGHVNPDAITEVERNVQYFPAHAEADMLQSFATAAGTKAYRDTKDGSWFVTALCKVLKEHACNDDLLSMMTRVNSQVMANLNYEQGQVAVQMAEFKSTLKKKVRFYPQ